VEITGMNLDKKFDNIIKGKSSRFNTQNRDNNICSAAPDPNEYTHASIKLQIRISHIIK
jgi:hypothetical protein